MKKTKVIYIVGHGRSGSTLLDRLLGQIDGYFSCGETKVIWESSMDEQLCGCGELFYKCSIWQHVLHQVEQTGGMHYPAESEYWPPYKKPPYKKEYFPLLISPWKSKKYAQGLACFKSTCSAFYSAVLNTSGASVVVDSSKNPLYALTLSTIPTIDLRVIHLIRDSRAVAYSWSRKKEKDITGTEYLPVFSPLSSSRDWALSNLLVELVRRRVPSTSVRYESLICNPAATLRRALREVGLEEPPLDFLDGNHAILKGGHTLAGNPMRFQQGRLLLYVDDEWEHCMKRSDKVIVTVMTAPLLRKYDYPFVV